jgi:RNA polymerase sigma-70 factor (ECF subfamily)
MSSKMAPMMESTNAADLFERHHLTTLMYFKRATGRSDTAEDLAQELFLTIVRALPGYKPMGREKGWVFRIAQTVLAKHFRPNRPEEVGIEAAEDVAYASLQVLGIGLAEALQLLPAASRVVFLLREVSGLTYAEIADATGATEDAVRARLFRTRIQLRSRLCGRSRATATSVLKDFS